MQGDKISFNAGAYESLIDHNAWSPLAYPRGWKSIPAGESGSGSETITPSGGIVVEQGASQTFTMTADSGSAVKDVIVDGASVGSVAAYTFTDVASAHSITVEFKEASALNTPPAATDDNLTLVAGESQTVNVLANDSDVDGDPLTISAVSTASRGSARLAGNSIIYTANTGAQGADTFTYTIRDGQGGQDTATVHVSIEEAQGIRTFVVGDVTIVFEINPNNVWDGSYHISGRINDADKGWTMRVAFPNGQQINSAWGIAESAGSENEINNNSWSSGSGDFTLSVVGNPSGVLPASITFNDNNSSTQNAAPQAENDFAFVAPGGSINVYVLSNDTDADGDQLVLRLWVPPAKETPSFPEMLLRMPRCRHFRR